jgi:xylose isomerase
MVKYGVITGSLGNIGDRYCLRGYKSELTLEEKLSGFSGIPHLEGVEISQDEVDGLTAEAVLGLFNRYKLRITAIGLDLTSDPVWRYGAITSADADIRQNAVAKIKRTIDFTAAAGCGLVNVWLGQDGFDYPFQADYGDQWRFAVESLRACADHNPRMRLAVEPKPREPRNRSFIDTTTTGLLLVRDVDRPNAGVTVDVGHVLQEGKNMAQSVMVAHGQGKLFNLHINDNYGAWDDDMVVGSVHTVEFLELFYYLKKIGYDGFCSIDIFPYREESMQAVSESVQHMDKFNELIDRMGVDRIDVSLKVGNPLDTLKYIRESIYK